MRSYFLVNQSTLIFSFRIESLPCPFAKDFNVPSSSGVVAMWGGGGGREACDTTLRKIYVANLANFQIRWLTHFVNS